VFLRESGLIKALFYFLFYSQMLSRIGKSLPVYPKFDLPGKHLLARQAVCQTKPSDLPEGFAQLIAA
jgi:hypothetical protein